MGIDRTKVEKILVIKLRAVGDVLLSTIVTKNLRLAFPDAHIDFLIEPPSVDVLKGNPFINGTLVYDKSSASDLSLIRKVREGHYDLVIDLFGNPRTALVTFASGARYRVGYEFRWRTYAYNVRVRPRGALVHNTQFNLDALTAIGVEIRDWNIYFNVHADDAAKVDEMLCHARLQDAFLIGICTGGGWYTKRWGLRKFAAISDRLIEEHGAAIVLTWGPGQLSEVETVAAAMKHKAFIPPDTTLSQLGALLKRCSIVVGNDSGPMHIAAAVGTPVLGIYGPTNPGLQGPYGTKHLTVRRENLDCLGCNLTRCPIGHPCMEELSVETVAGAVHQLLQKNHFIP